MVLCLRQFAKEKKLDPIDAYNYLAKYKGIEFLEQHYEIEHTLGFHEIIDDLVKVCRREGGSLI